MTTVAELVTRVNGLKTKVDEAAGQQVTSSDKLTTTQADIEGKAAEAKSRPDESRGYKTRAEAAKPKVSAIPGINDITKELHKFAVPEPDFCLPLISNLDLERGFGNVTFTRSTTATYIDKSGVLRTANANEPRFEREGILIEGTSTNLIPNSLDPLELVTNDPVGATQTPVPKGAVNGVSTSYKVRMKPYLSGYYQVMSKQVLGTVGDARTCSVWLKGRIGGELLTIADKQNNGHGESGSKGIILTSNWVRYEINIPQKKVKEGGLYITKQAKEHDIEFEYCFPQVEKLPFATSYIPTTGSAVTRGYDDLKILDDGGYSPVTVSFYNDIKAKADTYTNFMSFSGIGALPRVESNSNSRIAFAGRDAGTDTQYYLTKNDMKWDGSHLVTALDNGRSDFYENGIKIASNQQTNKQYSKGIYIGLPSSSRPGVIHLRNLRLWHTALTDDQIAML